MGRWELDPYPLDISDLIRSCPIAVCDRGGVAPLDPIEFDDPAVPARAAGMEFVLVHSPIFSSSVNSDSTS